MNLSFIISHSPAINLLHLFHPFQPAIKAVYEMQVPNAYRDSRDEYLGKSNNLNLLFS